MLVGVLLQNRRFPETIRVYHEGKNVDRVWYRQEDSCASDGSGADGALTGINRTREIP